MQNEDLIYGYHVCLEYIRSKSDSINKVLIQNNKVRKYREIINRLREEGIRYDIREKGELDKITKGGNHQGILIYTSPIVYSDAYELISSEVEAPVFLLLDRIEDPQNLGSIIRTAAAAGVDGIIMEKRKCSQLTSTVVKVSSGGLAKVKIARVSNIKNIIEKLKEKSIPVVATIASGEWLWTEVDYRNGVAFILGNENTGVRKIIAEKADYRVRIPLSNQMDSLNVAVACGIILYEAVRQKMMKPAIK